MPRMFELDELDEYEPLPTPKKRLWAVAVCSFLAGLWLFVPFTKVYSPGKLGDYDAVSIFYHFLIDPPSMSGDYRIIKYYSILGLILLPTTAGMLATALCIRLTQILNPYMQSTFAGIISLFLCVLSLLWSIALFGVVYLDQSPEQDVTVFILAVGVVNLVVFASFFLSYRGGMRTMSGVLSAAALNAGMMSIFIYTLRGSPLDNYTYRLFFPLAPALAAAILAILCMLHYRKQIKLDIEIRERARARDMGLE